MSAEEELQEHAEHAREPFDKMVAGTMAILAAGLAIVSVLGHLATTEEILNQQKASDQWAYYQAKSIRRYVSDIARDTFAVTNAATASSKSDEYAKNSERYTKEGDEIQKEAKALEDESHYKGRQAFRFELAEIFLEVGIVFASLAILSKMRLVWYMSMLLGLGGVIVALTSLAVQP